MLWIFNSVVCPTCRVVSSLRPDYQAGQGTSTPQRMSYCGHPAEFQGTIDFSARVLWAYPSGLACIKYEGAGPEGQGQEVKSEDELPNPRRVARHGP